MLHACSCCGECHDARMTVCVLNATVAIVSKLVFWRRRPPCKCVNFHQNLLTHHKICCNQPNWLIARREFKRAEALVCVANAICCAVAQWKVIFVIFRHYFVFKILKVIWNKEVIKIYWEFVILNLF